MAKAKTITENGCFEGHMKEKKTKHQIYENLKA